MNLYHFNVNISTPNYPYSMIWMLRGAFSDQKWGFMSPNLIGIENYGWQVILVNHRNPLIYIFHEIEYICGIGPRYPDDRDISNSHQKQAKYLKTPNPHKKFSPALEKMTPG